MHIRQYQMLVIRRLLQWSLISLGMGSLMIFGTRFWRDLGKQFIGWALVNLGIVYFGIRMNQEQQASLPDPDAQHNEGQKLRRLLEINTLIDVLYMAGGRQMMRRGSRGTGLGILIQGGFLFLFDLYHAGQTPDAS